MGRGNKNHIGTSMLATQPTPNLRMEQRIRSACTHAKELPLYQRIVYKLLFLLGVMEFARFCNRTNTMILCYHGVTERFGPDPEDRSSILVNRSLFRTQLAYIKNRYRVTSLREFLLARENRQPLPPHSVILTFDDGQRNFLTVVAPIL